jgi:hypothetical protein
LNEFNLINVRIQANRNLFLNCCDSSLIWKLSLANEWMSLSNSEFNNWISLQYSRNDNQILNNGSGMCNFSLSTNSKSEHNLNNRAEKRETFKRILPSEITPSAFIWSLVGIRKLSCNRMSKVSHLNSANAWLNVI